MILERETGVDRANEPQYRHGTVATYRRESGGRAVDVQERYATRDVGHGNLPDAFIA